MSAPRIFWRLVRTHPLNEQDFKSKAALGETMYPRCTSKRQRYFEGISVYDDSEVARDQARRFRPPYRYVAELEITTGGSIRFERSFGEAHFTIWALPEELLSRVVSVSEVPSGKLVQP